VKFSVIHPTARVTPEFVNAWWDAARSVLVHCENPKDVEYILVVHSSRIERAQLQFDSWFENNWCVGAFGRFTVVVNYGRDCLVDQSNAGIEAATGEILVGNQDDMRFPQGWDTELSRLIPDTSELVCIQARTDGSRRDLLTIPMICTRSLSRLIGTVSSDYESMFSDDEWSMKAWRLGKVVQSPLYFEHLHFTVGKSEMDSVYELENRKEAYAKGWEVFQARKAAGFPRVPFPGEDAVSPPAIAPPDYPILAMCIPGENFSGMWLDGFLAMGGELRDAGYIVKRYRGCHSNVYNTRIELAERVIEDARISGDRPKYVLWIDHDNVAAPGQLTGLIRFLDAYPNVDAVAGWCWIRKTHGWTTSAGFFSEDTGVHLLQFNLDAMFAGETHSEKFAPKEIKHTGFPFFLMRYDAMEKLGQYAFRPLTKADLPALFDGDMPPVPVADHWFSGEDSSWCLQARKAGMTIVVDVQCKVLHLKLQPQEPTLGKITPETAKELIERDVLLQGRPVEAPPEYERVGAIS